MVFRGRRYRARRGPSCDLDGESFAAEVRILLLALGLPTTPHDPRAASGPMPPGAAAQQGPRAGRYERSSGSSAPQEGRVVLEAPQAGNRNRIHLPRKAWDEIVPVDHLRGPVVLPSSADRRCPQAMAPAALRRHT